MNETFFADLSDDVPQRPQPIIKEKLTTVHKVKMSSQFKPITDLATSVHYCEHLARENAQNVYLLIDDTTPPKAEIDPMLGQAYQALTRAAQLLFEAETHLYRYANRHEAENNFATGVPTSVHYADIEA